MNILEAIDSLKDQCQRLCSEADTSHTTEVCNQMVVIWRYVHELYRVGIVEKKLLPDLPITEAPADLDWKWAVANMDEPELRQHIGRQRAELKTLQDRLEAHRRATEGGCRVQ